ncbi:MAG: GreA/GreB family elongation factor [Candidatus Marinimicrobia bacterium]|nr:GreA/GreB family elongation factor [Candidatus Neomarinimicrobiota bacterium]
MESEAQRGEEWFLAQLEADEQDVGALIGWLDELAATGQWQRARTSAELLEGVLVERGAGAEALPLLERQAVWSAQPASFREGCRGRVLACLGDTPEARLMVELAGFEQDAVKLPEAFRRLDTQRRLAPGVLVYEKTWGGGRVARLDWFDRRVIIDFENRAGHGLALVYAAEALQLVEPDHLIAWVLDRPDELRQLARDNPAEVARMALRSFGPLTIPQLQEQLTPRIFPADQWKKFWDGARKGLKADPCCVVPVKRTEPLRWTEQPVEAAADPLRALAGERSMPRILKLIEDQLDSPCFKDLDADGQAQVADRLQLVMKGAVRHPELQVRALLAAHALRLPSALLDHEQGLRVYFEPSALLPVLSRLPARDRGRLLRALAEMDAPMIQRALLTHLGDLESTALREALTLLLERGQAEPVQARVRQQVEDRTIGAPLLSWLLRNEDCLATWSLGHVGDLALWALRALEVRQTGEGLKQQNELRKRIEQPAWLTRALEALDPPGRRELARALRDSPAWPPMDRRSLLAYLVKADPELQETIIERREERDSAAEAAPLTSPRMFRARQLQLQRIVERDMPQVARDIGIAREYGDLRENAEYKAAKEKQGLLMRRQAELEQMLGRVRVMEFSAAAPVTVVPGCQVRLLYPSGARRTYCILGIWDSEDALGIISCDSLLARALLGKGAGETVSAPDEEGDGMCAVLIEAIDVLPPAVQAWAEGEPA